MVERSDPAKNDADVEERKSGSLSSQGNGFDQLDLDDIDQDFSPRQQLWNLKKELAFESPMKAAALADDSDGESPEI